MKIDEALKDNPHALEFVQHILDLAHFFDDVADGDAVLPPEHAERAARLALVELPANPFYIAHFAELHPLVEAAVMNWTIANAIEREPEEDRDRLSIAFIIRSSYVDLIVKCAKIVGGYFHSLAVAAELRATVHSEGFEGYLQNLRRQKGVG